MLPYGYCFNWDSHLVALRATTGIVLGSSYIFTLYLFGKLFQEWERKRYAKILTLYSSFIFLCGLGHYVRVWNIWNGNYWAEAFVFALTALTAIRTVYEIKTQIPSMVGTIRDRAQKETWLKIFVEECPAPVAILDKELNYKLHSKSWVTQFGLQEQCLIGQNHYEVFSDILASEERRRSHQEVLTKGVTISQEDDSFISKDGKKEYISWKIQPIFDASGKIAGIFILCQVVTEKKKKEQEILNKNEELQVFAYTASHDLRSPIRTVAKFADFMREMYANKLDDDGKLALEYIISATATIDGLLDALLDWSRVNSQQVVFAPCNLNELLASILKSMAADIQAKDALVGSQQLPEVDCDRAQLGQVFTNLIANSLKFSSPEVPPVIGISCNEFEEMWLFSISDNGVGFDSKYYGEKIFMPFQRLVRDSEYAGRGIGLAIVAKIIARHGGKIWAESEPWKGATFCFTLPKTRGSNV